VLADAASSPVGQLAGGERTGAEQAPDASFADLERLVAENPLPVLVKGVLRADDARASLDAGAAGVIVPLVSSPAEAEAAVRAARYPPRGVRSFGPTRSGLRIGPEPAASNDAVVVLAMIETAAGLAEVAEIAATPGLDGLYIGPNDLRLALGGATPEDPALDDDLAAALVAVREACDAAGIAAGIFTTSGEAAAQRLREGFTFVTVAFDLLHLEQAARDHLGVARAALG
jgi:4-hydroxy-2-oxoheptanedioate aldolase